MRRHCKGKVYSKLHTVTAHTTKQVQNPVISSIYQVRWARTSYFPSSLVEVRSWPKRFSRSACFQVAAQSGATCGDRSIRDMYGIPISLLESIWCGSTRKIWNTSKNTLTGYLLSSQSCLLVPWGALCPIRHHITDTRDHVPTIKTRPARVDIMPTPCTISRRLLSAASVHLSLNISYTRLATSEVYANFCCTL